MRSRTTQQLPQAQGRPRSPVRASLLRSSRPGLPRAQSVKKASAHQLHLIIAQSVNCSFRPTPNSPGPTRRCSWMLNLHAIPQVRAIYETVVYFSRFETNCDCDSFGILIGLDHPNHLEVYEIAVAMLSKCWRRRRVRCCPAITEKPLGHGDGKCTE